ncbi:MAG TPA: S8 family peptidase [Verrucomicrobiae bacterium]|nr:S8 family peptidase [Verrucomicrobiae bacterium]
MPTPPDFPHLHLTFSGAYEPHFHGGPRENPEIDANRANPKGHANRIRGILGGIRQADAELRRLRAEMGLPAIPADRGFLLRLPEGVDVESLVRALGVELVAETEEGVMLVSSVDLQFTKLEEVLKQFELGERGGGAGASLLDIYEKPDDPRRLEKILAPEILALWPLADATTYTLDLGIQTATSTRDVKWPRIIQRGGESDADFQQRRENKRRDAWVEADTKWQEKAEARVKELQDFIKHYGGEIISGMISDPTHKTEHGMVFPDSVQVRVRMNGTGFRDVILNFAHLFEVALPPELQQPTAESHGQQVQPELVVRPPAGDAPTVCVIDSGIEEGHRWLEPAIDSDTSRCFMPGVAPDDVTDYVNPQGHGTRVAGAVLYPDAIPATGEVEPVAWIQNARVLDATSKLPGTLTPEEYLHEVVSHFHAAPRFTKIFNHSINANVPCPKRRMSSWAAKLDQLSHEQEVLFIQSAGNQDRRGNGDHANPGLSAHLDAGKQPPDHQLEASMRVANPAQSLHALTVGSVSPGVFEDANWRSFAPGENLPSGFSRTGYGEPWSVVKPEVVEVGGDLVYSKTPPRLPRVQPEVAVELLNSTMHGEPAYSRDGVGTSFAAPKVAHVAAHLQNLFPAASPLLYRALIVQSARWPGWAENEADKGKVLRLIGYGVPSLQRATMNSERRVTLITPDAEIIPSKQLHLYTIRIPEELRTAALEAKIRVDVTLAYTALPRRTRARRTGYLETWLDWESSKLSEPRDEFLARMQNGGASAYEEFPWALHKREGWGEAEDTCRNRGTVQKDWAVFDSFNFPEEFAIAVRSHIGWNHLPGAGTARYCLAVSFEVMKGEVPIYSLIESAIPIEAKAEIEIKI